ncbi:sialate O-acetylesterase, partial [bacterium]|nr:sialate O-acetylesterase [bacterium]
MAYIKTIFFFSLTLFLFTTPTLAEVTLHSLFTDHAVLQQGKEIPVWGQAEDGEQITVSLNDQTAKTTAQNGEWMVKLQPMQYGGPFTLTVTGKNTLTREDIHIGEVWVCSGQSNMQWSMRATHTAYKDIPNANHEKIRLFSVPRTVAGAPQDNVNAEWAICTPKTVEHFTAVGYHFGRELHEKLGVPVGLIHSSWGGTPAESWTTKKTLKSKNVYSEILNRWERGEKSMQTRLQSVGQELEQWQEKAAQHEKEGRRVPAMPSLPRDQYNNPWRPAGLYNAMIAPLIPYAIQGAIWYQGESNASRAYQYRELFQDMIQDWRREWNQGPFPFLFVQLANYIAGNSDLNQWAELREAQTMALDLPNTGMAVTTDIGNPYDIHPRNKKEVGRRLSLDALKIAYDKDVLASGPMYNDYKIDGNKIILSFDHVGSGLT